MSWKSRLMHILAGLSLLGLYPSVYITKFYFISEELMEHTKVIERNILIVTKAISKKGLICIEEEKRSNDAQVMTLWSFRVMNGQLAEAAHSFGMCGFSMENAPYTYGVLKTKLRIVQGIEKIKTAVFSFEDYLNRIIFRKHFCDIDEETGDVVEGSQNQERVYEHKKKLEEFLEKLRQAYEEHESNRWAIAAIAWPVMLLEVVGLGCLVLILRGHWKDWRRKKRTKSGGVSSDGD